MLSALLAHGHDRAAPGPPVAGFECWPSAAGYEQRRAERYRWDGMARGDEPFAVIQHTLSGEGRLDFAGARYRLRPGQTMVVLIPHAHIYYLQRGGEWDYFWLILRGREALRLARAVQAAAGPVLDLAAPGVERLAAACLTVLSGEWQAGALSAAAYGALAALHDGVGQPGAAALPPAIARAMAYAAGNLASPLQVDALAAVAGLSRAHFVRSFTAAVGVAPSPWVRAQRLDRAERLLLASEMTVGQIATATGFADGNTLAKVLRRDRGLAPLSLRAARAEAGAGR
jgi:AraC family transcriptional regulator